MRPNRSSRRTRNWNRRNENVLTGTRQKDIRKRVQYNPWSVESMLRSIAKRKKSREAEAEGASKGDSIDFNLDGGEGESCKEVDGIIQCFDDPTAEELSEMATEDEAEVKEPFSLRLAESIARRRDRISDRLKDRESRLRPRRTLDLNPENWGKYQKGPSVDLRNPFARARTRSLQRRQARKEGRKKKGTGIKFIKSPSL
jgi:hypothetical protein